MARQRSRNAAPIKNLRWGGSTHQFNIAAGTAAQTFITDGSTETLMRIRGNLVAWIDGLEIPAVGIAIGIGLLVVQAGSSTTVIQSPLTDPEALWLWYESFVVGYEEYVTDVIDAPGLSVFRREIDSKAMRILRPGREVQLVMENVTTAGAGTVNLQMVHRTLLGTH